MYEWTMVAFMFFLAACAYWVSLRMAKVKDIELTRLSNDIAKRIDELADRPALRPVVIHLEWVKTNLDYIITGVKPCDKP